ncbi:MAG: ribonucleoside triphosphate reductase, partial [bacterium]
LDNLSTYCCGWDLYDLILRGFGGVSGKIESKPPKHFRTALGQLVNFFYTLQGESAGALAISSFDTLLAPFVKYDNLDYNRIKQAIQEFLFNMAIPTRVGFQTPFTNITLDITSPSTLANQPVIIGGKPQDETYGDFQEEMNMINQAFYEGMMEGDAKGRPFTFPIPTVNIGKDFDWDSKVLEPLWEATAKYGINYFSNFINSDMKPEDTRSMCCRLKLDNRELLKRGGGLFGSQPLTGSIGVVTINMPRIGYLSKTKKDFFDRLEKLMDLAKESLEIKRKALDNFMEKGLYPYSRHYLDGVKKMRGSCWGNHFSTIGLLGMNEALLNFIEEDTGSARGKKFTIEILDFMRDKLVEYQKETDNLYNLEATPAEGASYRLALKDKEKYPDIITAGSKNIPYYTNSTQLPVNYTDDVFEALKLQDDMQCQYTGGTVLHIFLGEKISNPESAKALVKKIFEKFRLPYITLTPTFSICPVHGYISGEHFDCPQCTIKQPCEVYSRIVGYLRPVQQWNNGKREEYDKRKVFKIPKIVDVK